MNKTNSPDQAYLNGYKDGYEFRKIADWLEDKEEISDIPSLWFMIKLKLFGQKLTECAGKYIATWYVYKNKRYLAQYKGFHG